PESITVEVPVTTGPGITDSTSRLWWVILATALSLITFLCGYLAWDILSNRNTINQYVAITNDTLANASPDIIVIDTLDFIEEPLPEDTLEKVEPPVEPVTPQNNEPPCFVVVGAFSNSDNVSRMEERLKGSGYIAELIKGGSLTKVAIRTSCDKSTLQKTLDDARATINPEAWIY
ncbi:MAG TPA: SPOR domain-containing protein, partial [Saprospiraceae bacterium]|nr:SPOR domain-containing protein [Saprospiraceae bacterium]